MKNEFKDGSNYNFVSTTVSVSDHKIGYNANATVWTVGGSTGEFTFFDGENYLYAYVNKVVYNEETSYYRNIGMASSDDVADKVYEWSVTKYNDAYNMYAPVITEEVSRNVYMEWYSSAKNPDHFCGYSYANNSCPIQFYKIYSSDDFANDFNNAVGCDATGENTPTLSTSWANLENLYSSIYSPEEREMVQNASYIVSGSGIGTVVTPDGDTSAAVAEAVSKYDFIIFKYGTTNYRDFLERNIVSSETNSLYLTFISDNNNVLLIVIIAVSLLVTIPFIVLKRRKHI